MHVRLPGRRTVVAHAFPSSDADFASTVSAALDAARAATSDADDLRAAVTSAVRDAYPNAHVVVQGHLAKIVDHHETWYVFRDGVADEDHAPRP